MCNSALNVELRGFMALKVFFGQFGYELGFFWFWAEELAALLFFYSICNPQCRGIDIMIGFAGRELILTRWGIVKLLTTSYFDSLLSGFGVYCILYFKPVVWPCIQ